jgi:phosphatidate phosphatase LPIN
MNVSSALGWILGSSSPVSGAIDVVSVRQEDGSFTCSPFHVKLPVRAKTNGHKIVSLRVNGEVVKVAMRLGSAGEAFFLIKNEEIRSSEEEENENNMIRSSRSPVPASLGEQSRVESEMVQSEGQCIS